MKNLERILYGKIRIALLLMLISFAVSRAKGQLGPVCEAWTVDSSNDVYESDCVQNYTQQGTTEIDVSVDVGTANYEYVPQVAARAVLTDNNGDTYQDTGYICGFESYGSPEYGPAPGSECQNGIDDNGDGWASTSATYNPTLVYAVYSYYGECYDFNGQGGWGPPSYDGNACQWSYGNDEPWSNSNPWGYELLSTSLFNPAYQIATLFYSPPGNQSKSGFGTGTTNGTTTTIGDSFTQSYGLTFTFGLPKWGIGGGGSYTYSNTTTNSKTFTEQFTDATSITTDDNSNSAYNTYGLDGDTLSDAISHHLDTFEIQLNPQATVVSDGSNNLIGYSASVQSLDGSPGQPDVLPIVAKSMESNNLYPSQLNPQPVETPNGQLTVPGMAAICANVNQNEYQPGNCNQSDQCGCQTSDYNTILSADALLGWNSSTETASPYSGTADPLDADASGESTCLNNPGPSYDCRYVIVPESPGSTVPLNKPLSGDQGITYSINDSTTDTQNIGSQHQYSVSSFLQLGPAIANVKFTDTFAWTDFSSTGVIVGYNNSQSVLLQTSTASCQENVSLYEDTIYHTFAFSIPTGNLGCN